MTDSLAGIDPADARQLWASLASEGKAPAELTFASQVLPTYSVGIAPWIDRLAQTYLCDLSRRSGYFKLIIAPYGGGKTHFLMALGTRALTEGFAVSYVACTQGVGLDSPLDVYRSFIKFLRLPNGEQPGLSNLLRRIAEGMTKRIERAHAPNPDRALTAALEQIASTEYLEPTFGRVAAEALRGLLEPTRAAAPDGALRWLRGEVDTLTKEELSALHLAKPPAKARAEFGRNILFSLIAFAKEHADINGVVILFDEVETLFNARGKALERVLSAMRVLVDFPGGVPGGVPLLGIFSAVPDVLEQLAKYPALDQRLKVVGTSFHEGGTFAPQIHLDKLGDEQRLLQELGERLVALGAAATGHAFDGRIQSGNAKLLARVAIARNLQVDARRLFVKTWVNILDMQAREGDRLLPEEELASRYAGILDNLEVADAAGHEP